MSVQSTSYTNYCRNLYKWRQRVQVGSKQLTANTVIIKKWTKVLSPDTDRRCEMPFLLICYTKYLFNHWPEKRSTGKSSSSAMWETYQATLELYGVVWKQLSSVNVCGRPKEIESTCNTSYRVLSLFVVFF